MVSSRFSRLSRILENGKHDKPTCSYGDVIGIQGDIYRIYRTKHGNVLEYETVSRKKHGGSTKKSRISEMIRKSAELWVFLSVCFVQGNYGHPETIAKQTYGRKISIKRVNDMVYALFSGKTWRLNPLNK